MLRIGVMIIHSELESNRKLWYYNLTMTRKLRRIIFLIALVIFLSAGYVAVLYAQGYRYNFAQAKFSRTGAISLHANTQAQVYLNGKLEDSTSFLTNSASVSGLLPATYTLSIQRDGYSKWQKKVTVQEGFVQDFPHVLILPTSGTDHDNIVAEIKTLLYPPTPSPTPTVSVSPAAKPSVTPRPTPRPSPSPSPSPTPDVTAPYYIDKNTLYVQTDDGPISVAAGVNKVYPSEDNQKLAWISGNQVWLYWLNDQSEQPFHKAGEIQVIGRFSQPVKAIGWFRGNAHLVVDIGGSYKVLELDTRGGQNIISI